MVAKQMGIDEDHVIIPAIGQVLETDGEVFRLGGEVPSGAVMVLSLIHIFRTAFLGHDQ